MDNTEQTFDLDNPAHYELVRRMYFARFSAQVLAAGIDTEDGLQAVFEGLVKKSQSAGSRWDPKRGALSTWIHVATSGLVKNLREWSGRQQRSAPVEAEDLALTAVYDPDPGPDEIQAEIEAGWEDLEDLAPVLIPANQTVTRRGDIIRVHRPTRPESDRLRRRRVEKAQIGLFGPR